MDEAKQKQIKVYQDYHELLKDDRVEAVITGNCGPKAMQVFAATTIEAAQADLDRSDGTGFLAVGVPDATKAVDAVLDSITGTLANGGSVSLVGFGTFSVKARAARAGRNPRTGETIQIKATNVPSFKAGKALKDAVN